MVGQVSRNVTSGWVLGWFRFDISPILVVGAAAAVRLRIWHLAATTATTTHRLIIDRRLELPPATAAAPTWRLALVSTVQSLQLGPLVISTVAATSRPPATSATTNAADTQTLTSEQPTNETDIMLLPTTTTTTTSDNALSASLASRLLTSGFGHMLAYTVVLYCMAAVGFTLYAVVRRRRANAAYRAYVITQLARLDASAATSLPMTLSMLTPEQIRHESAATAARRHRLRTATPNPTILAEQRRVSKDVTHANSSRSRTRAKSPPPHTHLIFGPSSTTSSIPGFVRNDGGDDDDDELEEIELKELNTTSSKCVV